MEFLFWDSIKMHNILIGSLASHSRKDNLLSNSIKIKLISLSLIYLLLESLIKLISKKQEAKVFLSSLKQLNQEFMYLATFMKEEVIKNKWESNFIMRAMLQKNMK